MDIAQLSDVKPLAPQTAAARSPEKHLVGDEGRKHRTNVVMDNQVGDVIEVTDDSFEAAPRTLRGRLRELITGAYKLDGRLLLVLDTDRALALSTQQT